MTHTINFNQAVQDAKSVSFEALPVGEYDVEVVESTATTSSSGKPMIKVKMKVIAGPYAPRQVFNQFVFSADNPTALSIFFRHMRAFGLDEGFFASLGAVNSLDPVAGALMNRRATVKLSHREWQGETRNNVEAFRPYAGGAPVGVPGSPSVPGIPGIPAMPPAPVPAPAPAAAPAPAPYPPAQPQTYPPAQPQGYAPAPVPAVAATAAPAPAYVDPALAEMTNATPQQPAYQPPAYAPPAAPAPSQADYAAAQQAYAPPPQAQAPQPAPQPAPQEVPQPPAVPAPPVPAPTMPI